MKPTDKPNSFAYQGSLFETGYLPEMGYMSNAINVCTWLANLELKPEQSTVGVDRTSCSISTETNSRESINYTIHENPGVDPEHRFIYIKTLRGYPSYSYVWVTFSWLKPVSEIRPETNLTPLSPEEASFWENTATMPSNISVTEYALPPEAENKILLHFVPEEARQVWKADTSPTPHKTTLAEIGYELNNMQLYRDGRLLFDLVTRVSNIYTVPTASGTIIAFIVEIDLGRENFLIQNDAITLLGGYAIYTSAPVLYQGELLWARMYSDRVEIKKSNGDVIFTFTNYWESNHYPRFRAWNGRWILEVGDFVIQDGEILNKKLGFEEVFDWGLVKDKPTYFFRKGSRVGISHDGQVLPIRYDNVEHGRCCEPAMDNPSMGQ
jgi:hypothetical protein